MTEQQIETFTVNELDELAGAMLYLGRVHTALATVLDVTRHHDDTGLFEYLNHAPVGLLTELFPGTEVLLTEASNRIHELYEALIAAQDSCAERAATELTREVSDDPDGEFAKIMRAEFGTDRKKNGG